MQWNRGLAGVVALLCAACGSIAPGNGADAGGIDGATDGGVGDVSLTDATVTDGAINPGPKPAAIVTMYGGAAGGCVTVPQVTVGDFGDPTAGTPARSVQDGAQQNGRVVSITCKVAQNASGGYELEARVAIAGDTTLTTRGTVDSAGRSNAGTFSLQKTSTWSSTTCRLDPTARPQAGVAPGRYWAMVSCMGSTSDTGAVCDIFGELRLENCAQQ